MSDLVIDQFCHLARQQKGLALVFLIEKVLSNPKIYVFGELLSLPSVMALQGLHTSVVNSFVSADDQMNQEVFLRSFRTLELFAYGTYQEYLASPSDYIALNNGMRNKLRQLTIVTLAETNKILPYSLLRKELDIDNLRELEDLIIETIYNGIVSAKMDQRASTLRVQSFMGRDVRISDVDKCINELLAFQEVCADQIQQLQSTSRTVQSNRERSNANQHLITKRVNANKTHLKESWYGA